MGGGIKPPSGQKTAPTENIHERRHEPPSDSAMYIKTAEKDGRVNVVGSNVDQAIKITEPVSQKRSQKQQHQLRRRGRENLSPLSEQPIKSLGRQYMAELLDKQMGRVVKQLSEHLAKIDQSQLPGKYKVWCTGSRRMWPLKMSGVPSFHCKQDGWKSRLIFNGPLWKEHHSTAISIHHYRT